MVKTSLTTGLSLVVCLPQDSDTILTRLGRHAHLVLKPYESCDGISLLYYGHSTRQALTSIDKGEHPRAGSRDAVGDHVVSLA